MLKNILEEWKPQTNIIFIISGVHPEILRRRPFFILCFAGGGSLDWLKPTLTTKKNSLRNVFFSAKANI